MIKPKLKTMLAIILIASVATISLVSLTHIDMVTAETPPVQVLTSKTGGTLTNWQLRSVFPYGTGGIDLSATGNIMQPFAKDYRLWAISFNMRKTGVPVGELKAGVWEINATGQIAQGLPLYASTNSIPMENLLTTANGLYYNFTFDENSILHRNTGYVFALYAYSASRLDGSNYIGVKGSGEIADDQHANFPSNLDLTNWAIGDMLQNCISYGYEVGVQFDDEYTTSSNECGTYTNMTFTAMQINNPIDYYVFSWDLNGTYVEDDAVQFDNSSISTVTVTKLIHDVPLGTTVHWKIIAYDSVGVSSESAVQSFTVQATITFLVNDFGMLLRNGVEISNGTTTTYTEPTDLKMIAVPTDVTYAFQSFNWTNPDESVTTNNYVFTVNNQATFSATMYNVSAIFYAAGYNSGLTDGNTTGYANGWSDGWVAGYNNGWTDLETQIRSVLDAAHSPPSPPSPP